MSKNYYPIINQDDCIQCYACISECVQNVLREKEGLPIVLNPDDCIEYCTSCKDVCTMDAIEFFIAESLKAGKGLEKRLK